MPGMDGFALVHAIKADPAIAGTRLIILTSLGQVQSKEELRRAGIDAYLVKPVKKARLFDGMTHVMGGVAVFTVAEKSDASGTALAFPGVGVLGKTMVSYVPEKSNQSQPAPTSFESVQKAGKMRILLAEDNRTNQIVAKSQLRKLGYSADVVDDGLAALEALQKVPYDIILMDCQMPKMDGYEATRTIRNLEQNHPCSWKSPIHIIAMTANASPEDREKYLAAGMDDHLIKPVRARNLVRALEQCQSRTGPLPRATNLQPLIDTGLETIVPSVIRTFLETAERTIEEATVAVRASQAVEVALAAHILKGSCSNLGAARLRELCQQLENLGTSGSQQTAAEVLSAIKEEFVRVRTELLDYLESSLGSAAEILHRK